MSRVAKNEIYHQRDVSIAELSVGIDGVTHDDLIALAARWTRPEDRALTLLGDLGGRSVDRALLAQ